MVLSWREPSRIWRASLFGESMGITPASTATRMTMETSSSMRVRPREEVGSGRWAVGSFSPGLRPGVESWGGMAV